MPRRQKQDGIRVLPYDWSESALEMAESAHEDAFESHRGLWRIDDQKTGRVVALCYYNNHPYADDGPAPYDLATRPRGQRAREIAAFRAWMAEHGIRELAFASYPDDGYTIALIIEAPADRVDEIERQLELTIDVVRILHAVKSI